METSRNGMTIKMFQEGPLHKPFFIAIDSRDQVIIGPNKKTVTMYVVVSGAVHTGVEVCRMDSEMSGLVERPWLQLMCCAVCLPHGRNFR